MAGGPVASSARFSMSHALIIRRRAEHDMAEAGLWYETHRPGTAIHFGGGTPGSTLVPSVGEGVPAFADFSDIPL